jgi:glycosyltransferase involved in cell wall biosynthesis
MNKSKLPLISVVLPVYNCALYIEEALDSILNQTIQDFEIIIIDDCSTDETVKIIQSKFDKRIKLILKEQNKGLIDSLNIGFKKSTGKYIARMDGDDISLLNRFEKQLDVLESNPYIKVCGCWLQRFGTSHEIIKHKEHHDEIVSRLLLSCSMTMGAVMLDRKTFADYIFDENKKHVEDYDYWARVAWSGQFYNIQKVLYHYRAHETQVTHLYSRTQWKGDVGIKLFLFKKLNYNIGVYSDELITKMLLLNKSIEIREFKLFIKWINELKRLNNKSLVYSSAELKKVLKIFKRLVIFSFCFKNTSIGITKQLRMKALFYLSLEDLLFVLTIKRREIIKRLFKNE